MPAWGLWVWVHQFIQSARPIIIFLNLILNFFDAEMIIGWV